MMRRTRRRTGLSTLALVLLALIGCAPQRAELPPIAATPTERHRAGEFVWFDLLVDDPEAAKSFYGPLFGWTFESLHDGDFDTIVHRGRPIGGIVRHKHERDDEPDDVWLPSLSVPDVDEATSRARRAGAALLRKPQTLGRRGRVSVLRDPEGAAFVLLRAAGGDPVAQPPATGDFLWAQLWVRDHSVAVPFYAEVAGWAVGPILSHDGVDEGVFESDGMPVAGVIETPWERVHPNWLPYVRVDDLAKTVERAQASGGRLLVRGERLAILQDPEGAAIGIGLMADGEAP